MDFMKIALFFLILAGLHTGVMGATGKDLLGSVFGGSKSLGKRALFVLFGISAVYVTVTAFQTTEGFSAEAPPPTPPFDKGKCSKIKGATYNDAKKSCGCKDAKAYISQDKMACMFCPKGSVKKGNTCDCKKPAFDAKKNTCVSK